MPNPQIAKMAKLIMLVMTLSLGAFSLNAQATLTSITTSDGTELVYSSVSDVTWTKDANLLGTWLASSTDADGNGTKDIIDAIIQATYDTIPSYLLPVLKPQIDLLINESAFSNSGLTTWWGANAFVTYLNKINFGESNHWYLPTLTNPTRGSNSNNNGTAMGDEFVELFYQELGGTAGNIIPKTATFDNEEKALLFWTGTEYAIDPDRVAWFFATAWGQQDLAIKSSERWFVWAVSPGQISAVPEPNSVAMLLAGLGLMTGAVRRKQKSFA